jgi:hypothetical protein
VIGHTKAETWAKLEVLKHEVTSGINTGNNYTVADAARDFLANGTRHLAKKSVEDLAYHVNARIIPGLGRVKLKRLRADDVDYWLNDLAQDMAASSIAKRLSTLRHIIRFAEAHGHVEATQGLRRAGARPHSRSSSSRCWASIESSNSRGGSRTAGSRQTSSTPSARATTRSSRPGHPRPVPGRRRQGGDRRLMDPVISEGAQLIDDALGDWRPNQKGRNTGKQSAHFPAHP